MANRFKITSIPVGSSIKKMDIKEIDQLSDITNESIASFKSHGVWVLFGRKKRESWTCLQVGQSKNIGCEIISDVRCLSGEIKIDEGRDYINQFGNVVEGYKYDVYLTPREQIYKKIGEEYNDFVFVCICCGDAYKDNKKNIEKYVAWQYRPLFWRNGRSYLKAKDNVEEPKGIDKIDPNIKKIVDMMVELYNKQKK